MRVVIESNLLKDTWAIYIFEKVGDSLYQGKIRKDHSVELEKVANYEPSNTKGNPNIKPLFVMDGICAEQFFTALIDEMKHKGFMRYNDKPQVDHLKAVQDHLEDMRELVFKKGHEKQ